MRSFFLFFLVLFLVVAVFLGVGWFWWQQALRPVDPNSQTKTVVVIKKGSTGAEIAHQLRLINLIRSQKAFLFYLKLHPTTLRAGTFKLSRSMSLPQIIAALHQGPLDVWVTIPEGWRREEIAERLAASLSFKFDKTEFLRRTKNLEGYLFPDTYLIPQEATAQRVIEIMATNFERKARPVVKKAAEKQGLSQAEVVTLASLVEREGKTKEDKKIVASILLKRLKNDWPLQVDATLQYIEGRPGQWWPKVTPTEKKLNSPFNTYLNKGLPPHPIANPGLDSFNAVYQADGSTPYWFYISDKNGHLRPVRTLEEHNQNIRKYLKN